MIPIRFEHVLGQDVRNELVVDAYPCFAWLRGHVPVRMENIEGVVTTRGRKAVMIKDCWGVVRLVGGQ